MASKPISVILRAVVGPYQASMAKAAGVTKAFQTSVQNVGPQVGNMGQSLGMVNAKLVGGAGLAFGLKKTIDAAMGWESAFAGVRKTVNATEGELAGLEDGIRKMALEIPTSATELAGIAEAAGQLGIKTGNIEGFTRTMADLGETTNLSGEQAATALARFSNITGMAQTDFDKLGSTIVELGNSMATTESEIVEMGLRLAGAGAQVGMSEADILGLAAALSSVGIEAEAGGSALSKVMIEIASEVETSGDKLATFARVAGMTAEEFATAWRDDAAGALSAFVVGLGNMEGQGQTTLGVLEELGISEVRMRDALLRASGAADQFAGAQEMANEAWADNNALQEEAAQRYDTTEARIQKAKNAIHEMTIEIGDGLLPAVAAVADGLADIVGFDIPTLSTGNRALNDAFGGLSVGEAIGGGIQDLLFGPGTSTRKRVEEAAEAYKQNAEAARDAYNATHDWKDMLPEADRALMGLTGKVNEHADAFDRTEARISGAVSALASYIEKQREATDPVFALVKAIDAQTEAQEGYDEAVKEHGVTSEEAKEAALEHFEAQQNVAGAAAEAATRFPAAITALQEMAASGRISGDELNILLGVLRDVQPVADSWAGTYTARFDWDADFVTLLGQINAVRSALGQDAIPLVDTYTPPATLGVTPRAMGGPFGHGEMMLVGEQGPELVAFGRSGTVMPAQQTAAALSGTTINGGQMVVQPGAVQQKIVTTANDAARTLNRELRLMARGY